MPGRSEPPAPSGLASLGARLDEESAAFLRPYLEHSRATDDDLAAITGSGRRPPFLDGLRSAERILGPALLREIVGQLGWPRLACGFAAQPWEGVSVGGSFPLVVAPGHARLLAACGAAQVAWRRTLVIAHGGDAGGEAPASDDTVQRFRRYNVAHAELLDEILAVAPLDAPKVRRILTLLGGVVYDFDALFRSTSDDARRVTEVFARLKAGVLAELARDEARGALSGDTVRRVQAFEDPQRLDDVATLHGLKRYLHQQGLRLAFRLFRSHAAANRTVDLLVAAEREELRREQILRYLEFEPTPPAGPAGLPFAVALAAEALGRQLLHGRKLPWVTLLGFGNELQIYVNYRNHPAFVRIDLSPPFRGGMIDVEWFGVSQYELDQHPDLSLESMQRVLRELDFDVEKEGLRLHARYDKERAVDLGDVVAHSRALFHLLPYLMDVDWVIGDLDYPPAVRAGVAAAWAGFFARWGALPAAEVLSASRRKVLVGIEPDPAGPREVVWDGEGAYRDRFAGTPPAALAAEVRRECAARGLDGIVGALPSGDGACGQWALEEHLVGPLREAAARGEIREGAAGPEPVPESLFRREHEALRLAARLAEGGAPLARAAAMAEVARGIERQSRFRTTGSLQGYAVQAATLPTAPHPVSLFVLRDAQGIIRLALASAGGVLYRARERADDPWQLRDEMDVPDLARILRAYNYVGDEARRGTPASAGELAELRARFAIPSAAPVQRHGEGDRVIPATIAAPGWAAGFTRFHAAGQLPADLDGAVLFAPALRPEDAPALRHASAIVSTGGGILSHVGLVALELGKPAVILDARWSVAESGAPALLYRRPQWREELSEIGPYRVVCRHDLHETVETLVPGDLVAVDAEAGSVIVLGHGAHAVSLHQDLHQLESASEALAGPRSDAEILACRGRLIRATHQLDRLLARIDGPALARHAVRELLTFPRGPFAAEGRRARTQLLATLLRNRACEREARTAAEQRVADLRARVEAARRSALEDVPHLENPGEVLYLQLRVRRMADTLADAAGLLAGAGEPFPHRLVAEVEDACRGRLSELREELTARAAGCAGEPSARSRLRHLVARLRQVDRALEGVEAPETARLAAELARTDAARRDELGRRAVLEARDGGLELRPLVGGKAAHLAEIVAVLGDAAVPPWFVVSDAAFRAALALPAPAARLEALRLGAAASLADAIAQATARAEWDAGRQAAAIRELWQDVALPAPLAEELGAAYLRLASPGGGDPLVAIRSSAREEDAEAAAWAGQFDTFLFVRGAAAVLEHLRLAWAGFWTERAIRHRRALRLPPEARGGGVIVQRMIEPRASGVLHTVSAASGQLREMVVNAGLGVGEGIVSGTVDVDHVTVSKAGGPDPPELQLRYRVGDKREQLVHDVERGGGTRRVATRYHQRFRPALEYVELRELVRAGALLERTFLTPLDIEFAVDGRGVHVVQARPVPLFDAAWRETVAGPPGEARPGPGEEPP